MGCNHKPLHSGSKAVIDPKKTAPTSLLPAQTRSRDQKAEWSTRVYAKAPRRPFELSEDGRLTGREAR